MAGNVLIAGAGIGGLTAALALHRNGVDVRVIERTDLGPVGVGINLLPHAVRVLHELGLGAELARVAVAPAAITYFDAHGAVLFREPRGLEGGYRYPQYSVHRGRLHDMLLTAVQDRLGANAVHIGTELIGFDESPGRVRARTSAGDVDAGVLVGADGIHSTVRSHLHTHCDPLIDSGVRLFRGTVRTDAFLDGRTMAIVKGDNGVELVAYPIGFGEVNWVVMMPATDADDRAAVVAQLSDWDLGWLDAADMVCRTEPVLEYPMVDRDPLSWWGRGRITLLGDAAHPMYPVGANGGSQAIVDAAVLGEELKGDLSAGLRRYEDRRRPETAAVVLANREMHRAGATRRPGELARVTSKYRNDTKADRSHP